jgi:hypothetical protein
MKNQLIAFLLFLALPALAQAGMVEITPAQMTCAQAQSILARAQSAVLNTTNIFGRPIQINVVARIECPFTSISHPIYMRTLDVRNCALGYSPQCSKDSAYDGTGA